MKRANHACALAATFLCSLALCGCAASADRRPGPSRAITGGVLATVGKTPITSAQYEHWMKIGAATVSIPVPGVPPPKPVAYEPPRFQACIASLEAQPARPRATMTQLRAKCRQIYTGIQARVLNFLITGDWIRGQATEEGVSVGPVELHKMYDAERRKNYPTAAEFQRFQEASLQSTSDLMFAVETRILSEKLLRNFTKTQGKHNSEQADIGAFNRLIRSRWTARTNCAPGYVVKDCKQYAKKEA